MGAALGSQSGRRPPTGRLRLSTCAITHARCSAILAHAPSVPKVDCRSATVEPARKWLGVDQTFLGTSAVRCAEGSSIAVNTSARIPVIVGRAHPAKRLRCFPASVVHRPRPECAPLQRGTHAVADALRSSAAAFTHAIGAATTGPAQSVRGRRRRFIGARAPRRPFGSCTP